MTALYTAVVTAKGGREGSVKSSDENLNVPLALPKSLGGPGDNATNPEQLFAGGYAACFESAIRHVASTRKIRISQSQVTATVGVGPRAAGGFELSVALEVSLPELDRSTAVELANYAHENICPYSHATRGNIDVKVTVV